MPKILRYLNFKIIITTFIMISILTALLIMLQSLRFVDLILNKGFPIITLLYLSFLAMPYIWLEFLFVAFLISIIFVWNNMNNNQEMIIINATGFSPWQITKSILLVSYIFTALTTFIAWFVIPYAAINYQKIRLNIDNNYSLKIIEPNKFSNLGSGITFYVKEIKGNELFSIIIHNENAKRGPTTIIAEKGLADFQYQDNNIIFLLDNVSIQEVNKEDESVVFVKLDKYIFNYANITKEFNKITRTRPDQLYFHELFQNNIIKSIANNNNIDSFNKEKFRRISAIIMPILAAIIACYFFINNSFSRHGSKWPIYMSLGVAIAVKFVTIIPYINFLGNTASTIIIIIPILFCLFLLIKGIKLKSI